MSRRPFMIPPALLLVASLIVLPACKKKPPAEDEGGGGGGGGPVVVAPATSSEYAVFAHLDAKQIYSNPLFADAKSAVAKSGGSGAWDKVDGDAGKEFGVKLTDIETATIAITEIPDRGEPKMVMILTSKAPFRKDGAFGLKPGTKPDSRGFYKSGATLIHFPNDKTAVAVSPDLADKYLAGYARDRSGWPLTADLTRAAAGHLAFAAVNVAQLTASMPADAKREFAALAAAKTVTVTADLKGKELSLGARATFPDAASAVQAQTKVLEFVKMATGAVDQFAGGRELADFPSLKPAVTEAQRTVKNVRVDVSGSDVTLAASYRADFDAGQAIADAVKKIEVASGRMTASNNLKQIGLALHSYHDAMGSLPVHAIGANGVPLRNPTDKPLLSWRVAILPYIEQDALYKQFKLNEPWDSEHNKKLIAQMPKLYAPVGKPGQPGKTHLQMVVGAGGMSPFGSRLQTIPDGTSNTIAVIEAVDAVEWTKPADVTLPAKPAPGALTKLFGGQFAGGMNVLMWDGSVRFVRDTVSENTLKLLFDPRDGMAIPSDW